MPWIPLVLLGAGIVLASWVVLILLARRLPPGLAKDLASFLPACATTLRRLRKDPRVPRSAKIAVAIAVVWVISPIDLIPEFLPVIGPLDDVVVVALALRFAAKRVPTQGDRGSVAGRAKTPRPPPRHGNVSADGLAIRRRMPALGDGGAPTQAPVVIWQFAARIRGVLCCPPTDCPGW